MAGIKSGRTRGKTNEYFQDIVKVAALEEDDDGRDRRTAQRGPSACPELTGEKMTQQSHAPMDCGQVQGEVAQGEGSHGKRRRREGARSEKQTVGRTVKNQKRKRALVCHCCEGTQRDCARHLQTTPPKLSTR